MLKALLVAVILIGAVVGVIISSNSFEYKHHGDAKFVYDTTSVDNTKAQRIHQFLLAHNAYQNKSGELFLLKKTQTGMWMLKFPVYQGGDVAPKVMNELESLATKLQQDVLNGETVEVHITNASYQSVRFFMLD